MRFFSRHVHLHNSAWDGSVKVILRHQAMLGSPRGVPGSAWESLCSVARTCEAVGAGRGSFPPEVRCAVLGDVVASVKEGPASRFRATRAVCSRQPSSWGLRRSRLRRAGPSLHPAVVPRSVSPPVSSAPSAHSQGSWENPCDPQLWPPICRPLGMTVGVSGRL